ncbi:MAG: GtrA family protein [Methylomicrobium sp.]
MRQFFLFLLCGGLAAALNWGSRFIFSIWLPFELAVVAAFFVGLLSGFLLMRWFVFNGKGQTLIPQAGKYLLVNILALIQTLLISTLFARLLLPEIGLVKNIEALAHLVGVLAPVITSYIGHKRWSFR